MDPVGTFIETLHLQSLNILADILKESINIKPLFFAHPIYCYIKYLTYLPVVIGVEYDVLCEIWT